MTFLRIVRYFLSMKTVPKMISMAESEHHLGIYPITDRITELELTATSPSTHLYPAIEVIIQIRFRLGDLEEC